MMNELREVYFDRTASKIVEQWVQPSGTSSTIDDIDNMIRKSIFSTNLSESSSKTNRIGIGYKQHSNKVTDELEQRLLNKKRKSKNYGDKDIESTKVMDDEKEETKLDIILSTKAKSRSISEAKTKASLEDDATIRHTPSSKTKSSDQSSGSVHPDTSLNDSTKQYYGPIRKRKKTRSKQKNIRRDHREQDEKPIHLQFGSKEYRGRPLSQETKRALHIDTVKKNKKRKLTATSKSDVI